MFLGYWFNCIEFLLVLIQLSPDSASHLALLVQPMFFFQLISPTSPFQHYLYYPVDFVWAGRHRLLPVIQPYESYWSNWTSKRTILVNSSFRIRVCLSSPIFARLDWFDPDSTQFRLSTEIKSLRKHSLNTLLCGPISVRIFQPLGECAEVCWTVDDPIKHTGSPCFRVITGSPKHAKRNASVVEI
jgi:hypothetical protein